MSGQERTNPYASMTTLISGERGGSTSAVQLPNVPGRMVKLKARFNNPGRVYIGGANTLTKADGNTDTTSGMELSAREETGWLPLDNLNRIWVVMDSVSDAIQYLVIR